MPFPQQGFLRGQSPLKRAARGCQGVTPLSPPASGITTSLSAQWAMDPQPELILAEATGITDRARRTLAAVDHSLKQFLQQLQRKK